MKGRTWDELDAIREYIIGRVAGVPSDVPGCLFLLHVFQRADAILYEEELGLIPDPARPPAEANG